MITFQLVLTLDQDLKINQRIFWKCYKYLLSRDWRLIYAKDTTTGELVN